jgi:hypothetical protein
MRSTKIPIYTGRYALVDSISGAIFSHFAKRNANPARNVAMPNSIMSIDESMPTSCPFPQIFNKNKVSKNGLILDDESSHNSENMVDNIPALSSLQSSKSVGLMIKSLAERCRKINLNKLHRFQDAGLENDELLESTESLNNLYECFHEFECNYYSSITILLAV